jgi:hypothetical protein
MILLLSKEDILYLGEEISLTKLKEFSNQSKLKALLPKVFGLA